MDPSGPPGVDETLPAPVSSDDDTMAAPDRDETGTRRSAAGRGLPATVGRYEILGQLGAGGMGVVYRARDPELAREVAIKLLRSDRGGGDTARLQREAQAMARVQHANLVTVFDVGRVDDQVFLAMEYVRGETLREWLRSKRRSQSEIVEAFVEAGQGLVAAHGAGIVHRDFKPDNVLVSTKGEVKVLDFGLAVGSAEDDSHRGGGSPVLEEGDPMSLRLTQTGALLGTPAYMSPEQFRGESTDARTDQFSFAVALFEALSGRRPFPSTTMGELAAAVTDGLVALPNDDSLGPMRGALLRALSPDRESRWPTLEALLEQLRASSENAVEATPKARLPPWLLYGAGALVLTSLVAVFAVSADWSGRTPPTPPQSDDTPQSQVETEMLAFVELTDPEQRLEQAAVLDALYGDTAPAWARLILRAELAIAAWTNGCPEPGPLGLCVGEVALENRCWAGARGYESAGTQPEVRKRAGAQLREVDALVMGAIPNQPKLEAAVVQAQAEVRLLAADAELEALLLRDPPTNPEVRPDAASPQQVAHAFAAFDEAFIGDVAALEKALTEIADSTPRSRVAPVLARLGMVHEASPQTLISIPVPFPLDPKLEDGEVDPRKRYCAALLEHARPLLEKARSSYRACEQVDTDDSASAWCSSRAKVVGERFESTEVPPAVVVVGPLSADEVAEVTGSKVKQVRACFNEALKIDGELEGRLATVLDITPSGHVSGAGVRGSGLPDEFGACIVKESAGWKYPASDGETHVVFPWGFAPG